MARQKKLDIVVRFFGRLLRVRATNDISNPTWVAEYCKTTKTVKVRPHIRGKDFFVWLAHECVHHCEWHVDEEWVEQFADDLGNLIYDHPEILARCGLQLITPRAK